MPRKTVKKLLDPATWSRDRRLHRAAEVLMKAVSDVEYDDYAVFEAKVQDGVPVELHLYPRAYHGFYRATNARVTRQAEHDNREALRRFLHG